MKHKFHLHIDLDETTAVPEIHTHHEDKAELEQRKTKEVQGKLGVITDDVAVPEVVIHAKKPQSDAEAAPQQAPTESEAHDTHSPEALND